MKHIILTKKAFNNLQDELNKRKQIVRNRIADDIDKARQQGDLSENSAYKSAMEEKEFNERKIQEIQNQLENAEVFELKSSDKHLAKLGSKIKIRNLALNQIFIYELVSETDADPGSGKISIISPLGSSLNNSKIKDKVSVNLPSGKVVYEILDII